MNVTKLHLKQLSILVASLLAAQAAVAGPTIEFGENKESSLSVGMGLRTSYSNADTGSGGARSNAFSLDNARIYLSGKLNDKISGMLNYDAKAPTPSGGTGEVIDANAQFNITPDFYHLVIVRIWLEVFIP